MTLSVVLAARVQREVVWARRDVVRPRELLDRDEVAGRLRHDALLREAGLLVVEVDVRVSVGGEGDLDAAFSAWAEPCLPLGGLGNV